MSFTAIRENKILAKIFKSTVRQTAIMVLFSLHMHIMLLISLQKNVKKCLSFIFANNIDIM